MNQARILVIFAIIVIAVILRILLTGFPNFSPVGAMALFAGAYLLNRKLAFILPIGVLLISDYFIGFHNMMWAVYLSIALAVGIGMLVARKRNVYTITAGALSGSIVFFIITNFAVWMGSVFYPQTVGGLLACYTAAIPFFHYTLAGDLFFASIFFGVFEYLMVRVPTLREQTV